MHLFANNLIYLKNKIVDENEQYVLLEIDKGMYQLVADDQVI